MNAKKVGLFLLKKMEEATMAPEAKAALLLLEHAPESDPRVLGVTIEILEQMKKHKTMPVFVASALDLLIEHQKNPVESPKRKRGKSKSISSYDSDYEEDEQQEEDEEEINEEEEEEESDAENHWSAASDDDEEEQESIVESSDGDKEKVNKRKRKEPDRFRHEDFEDDNSADKGIDIGVDNPSNGMLDALSRCLKVLDHEGYDECAKQNWWHKYFGSALKGVEDGCGRNGNAEFIQECIRIPCFERRRISFKDVSIGKGTCALCNGTHECSVEMRIGTTLLAAPVAAAATIVGSTITAPVIIEDDASVAPTGGPSVPSKDKEEEEEEEDKIFLLGAYCTTLTKRLLDFYICLRDHNSFENRRKKFQALKNKLAAVVEAHSEKRRKI